MTTQPRFIDMTPTWAECVNIFALALERGNASGRDAAMKEIRRMAELADVASVILGAHRRPDAPAIPEADAIRDAARDAAAMLDVYTSPSGRNGPNVATRGQAVTAAATLRSVLKLESGK